MDLENRVLRCFDKYGLIISGKEIDCLKGDIRRVFWEEAIKSWEEGEGVSIKGKKQEVE